MRNNVGLLLEKRARLSPELEGVFDVAQGLRFSYREVNERCNRTANALSGLGVSKGDRVGLLAMNSVEFFETFFAVAKIGAVCVPLNWRLVADELEFILNDSGVTTLVFGNEFLDTVSELSQQRPQLTGEGDGATRIAHLPADRRPGRRRDGIVRPGLRRDLRRGSVERARDRRRSHDDLLYIMYTSGTTGLPKGVVHTHSTALWGCAHDHGDLGGLLRRSLHRGAAALPRGRAHADDGQRPSRHEQHHPARLRPDARVEADRAARR